jgi:hypothetical protein
VAERGVDEGENGLQDREGVDLDQIRERLSWSPAERLQYLLDVLAFEERAHNARTIT